MRLNITPTNISIIVSHIVVHPDHYHQRCARRELKLCHTNFNLRLVSSRLAAPRLWKSTLTSLFLRGDLKVFRQFSRIWRSLRSLILSSLKKHSSVYILYDIVIERANKTIYSLITSLYY